MPTAISDKLTAQLDALKGTHRMYMGNPYYINGYVIGDESVRIETDSRPLIIKKHKLHDALPEFMEMADSESKDPKALQVFHAEADHMRKLKQITMLTIEKLQSDKDYIPQAREINSSVNTLLKMNQQMIDMYREMRKAERQA